MVSMTRPATSEGMPSASLDQVQAGGRRSPEKPWTRNERAASAALHAYQAEQRGLVTADRIRALPISRLSAEHQEMADWAMSAWHAAYDSAKEIVQELSQFPDDVASEDLESFADEAEISVRRALEMADEAESMASVLERAASRLAPEIEPAEEPASGAADEAPAAPAASSTQPAALQLPVAAAPQAPQAMVEEPDLYAGIEELFREHEAAVEEFNAYAGIEELFREHEADLPAAAGPMHTEAREQAAESAEEEHTTGADPASAEPISAAPGHPATAIAATDHPATAIPAQAQTRLVSMARAPSHATRSAWPLALKRFSSAFLHRLGSALHNLGFSLSRFLAGLIAGVRRLRVR
jgi:hypothetical protein